VHDIIDGELANLAIVRGNRVLGAVRRDMVGHIHDAHDRPLRVVRQRVAADRSKAVGLPEALEGAFDGRLLVAALVQPSSTSGGD